MTISRLGEQVEEESSLGERLRLEAHLRGLVTELSRLKLQKKKQAADLDEFQEELEQWKKKEESRTQESSKMLETVLQEWHEREQEHARIQAQWKQHVKPRRQQQRQQRDTPQAVTSRRTTKESAVTRPPPQPYRNKLQTPNERRDGRGQTRTRIYETLRHQQSARDRGENIRPITNSNIAQSTKETITEPSLSTYLQSSSHKSKNSTRRQVSNRSIISTQSSRASSTATASSFSKFLMSLQAESSTPSSNNNGRLLKLNTSYLRRKHQTKRQISSSFTSKKKKKQRRGSLGRIMERLEEETMCSSSESN